MRMLWKVAVVGCVVVSLAGCRSLFNPQTSTLSRHDECVALQRQMVYVDNFRTANTSHWDQESRRQRLASQYYKLHCNQVVYGNAPGAAKTLKAKPKKHIN